jgi:hypothetical protein
MKSGLLVALLVSGSQANAQAPEIIVYGQNAPAWNQKLGVTATRSSCNAPVDTCMTSMAALMNGQHTSRFYLNLYDDAKIVERAAELSRRSLQEPRLVELAVDDFADHWNGWCRAQGPACGAFLRRIIESTKARNRALRFGVTLYEDQLEGLLAHPSFTQDLRDRIDNVHLYFHARENGPRFEKYLARIKQAFPNARVIGGSYPYDRLDYEKCAVPAVCVPVEQRELQKETLRLEVGLLRKGLISAIEFYPGHFGWEDRLPAWNDPKACRPSRTAECVENTRVMHGDVLPILKNP